MVQETIRLIDEIDNVTLESEVDVLSAIVDQYQKLSVIMENCSDVFDMDRFSIFQEAAVNNDDSKNNSADTKKKEPLMIRLIHKIRDAIVRLIIKIAAALGFKDAKDIDEAITMTNKVEKVKKKSGVFGKVAGFALDHPEVIAVTGAAAAVGIKTGIDAARNKKFKKEVKQCFEQALNSLSEQERKIVSKAVVLDEGTCKIEFVMNFDVEYAKEKVNKFYDKIPKPKENKLTPNNINGDIDALRQKITEEKANKNLSGEGFKKAYKNAKALEFGGKFFDNSNLNNPRKFDTPERYNVAVMEFKELANKIIKIAIMISNYTNNLTVCLEKCTLEDKEKIGQDAMFIMNTFQKYLMLFKPVADFNKELTPIGPAVNKFLIKFGEVLSENDVEPPKKKQTWEGFTGVDD